MGFKTENNEITLKEFCNLKCIIKHRDVILYDHKGTIGHPITLSEVGCTVNDIPEIFANWYVEYFSVENYKDASNLMNYVYIFEIREPLIC